MRTTLQVLVLGLALSLVAAACDSGSSTTEAGASGDEAAPGTSGASDEDAVAGGDGCGTGAGSDAFPVTIEAANGPVEIAQRPACIVSLSATATEILFAVGAGEQVVAVDEQSTHPEEAPVTDLSGYTPNVEAIAGYDPDLVVVSDDIEDVVAGLEELDIPVLHQPAAQSLDDVYDQIEQLGRATGRAEAAETLADEMAAEIDDIVAGVPEREEPLTYYHELDDTYFTVTSQTFVGQIYALAGLENVADAADEEGSGYPKLSSEYLLEQDPDLVFLADTKCCGQSAETVAERPGWDGLTAVQEGRVVELDDDVASRWGPRVVDFLRAVVDAVGTVDEPARGGEALAALAA